MSTVSVLPLRIMFNFMIVPTGLQDCGYHQLCRARKWLNVCVRVMTHPSTHTLSQCAGVYVKSWPFLLSESFNSFGLRFGCFWCSALLRPADTHTHTHTHTHTITSKHPN